MSTPEVMPEQPRQPEVTPRVEQPVVSETLQQSGVTPTPQAPKKIVADDQVLVQPIPVSPIDPTTTLSVPTTIAMSEKDLEKGAHGPANLAVTWLDMFWLRQVGQALMKGWKVLFGQQ